MTDCMDNALKRRLRQYADRYETPDFVAGDPSRFMRDAAAAGDDANAEAVAVVASALSFGAVAQFLPKIESLVRLAGGDMDGWIRHGAFVGSLPSGPDRFYRYVTYGNLAAFLSCYQCIMRDHGTLGEYVRKVSNGTGFGATMAICTAFATSGVGRLVPSCASSACKRICLLLRWMVRSGSPVDLGLWSGFIDRRTLLMPLDTHVIQEAQSLGLLPARASATMATARRLTALMAEVFPDDPLRGDFALYGHHRETSGSNLP